MGFYKGKELQSLMSDAFSRKHQGASGIKGILTLNSCLVSFSLV
jgi:hypothetical protein